MTTDIGFALRFPTRCCEEVIRQGECQPCDKRAVAVRVDPQERHGYPVCARHARGDMVPLVALLEALRSSHDN